MEGVQNKFLLVHQTVKRSENPCIELTCTMTTKQDILGLREHNRTSGGPFSLHSKEILMQFGTAITSHPLP